MTNNLRKRFFTSMSLLVLVFLIFKSDFVLIFTLLLLSVFSSLEFFNMIKKIFSKNLLLQFFININFLIYIFLFCFLFIFFSYIPKVKIIIYLLLLGCIASDLGGYIIGKNFKGPKLTKISPNKTISGAVGSVIFTSILFLSVTFYFTNKLNLNLFLIAFITSLACQIGDLFFSYLKRKARIKDTGNIFPGHGGALDRLDSIFFGLPTGFIAFTIFY